MAGFGVTQYSAGGGDSSASGNLVMGERRKRYEILRNELQNERSSFETHWRDLSDYILPRRSRWYTADANKGDRRNQKIIDSTATLASRTLRSGMMAGITSPARPWFRLTIENKDLAEQGSVKFWLDVVTERMRGVMLKSRLYKDLPLIYGDMGVFATAAMLVEEDFEGSVFRTQVLPIGSYFLANDSKLRVRVFFREFRMTIEQLVERWGKVKQVEDVPEGKKTNRKVVEKIDWTRFSTHVRDAWNRGQRQTWVDVCHVIHTNDEHNPNRLESKFKRYRSVYYEKGYSSSQSARYLTPADEELFLSESGYDLFPVLGVRWEVTGEDVYGNECPGIAALGDIKQLQTGEKRGAQAIDKKVNPPMTGPVALKHAKASVLPGDITYLDVREGQQGFRAAHEVALSIQELEAKQEQVRQRIRRAFFEDLFLMLITDPRTQPPTAREIEERHEEKLLALGPVLEQLNQDLLDPLIDLVFHFMLQQGLIPEPPEEIAGAGLKVEYVSIMAQAQKLVGIGAIERTSQYVISLAEAFPEVRHKFDAMQAVDAYGEITGVPPKVIRSDEDAEALANAERQAIQAQAAAAGAREVAGAAKDLAGAQMTEPSLLKELLARAQAGAPAPGV